jgi:hypothetical protein
MHWSDRRASVAVPDSLSYARMARIGASRPLPRVAATVCFLITERALSLGGRNWSSCPTADCGIPHPVRTDKNQVDELSGDSASPTTGAQRVDNELLVARQRW